MHTDTMEQITPSIVNIQRMLQKIDRLHLPPASRRDLESILVRQVAKELDRSLPWQAGHAETTTALALRIGQAAHLDDRILHHLKLAALLHDVGLLMLPHSLHAEQRSLDTESYVAIQNHPRLGATLLEPFSFLYSVTPIVAHHHEHWDGSGYPYGLRGTFIPLGARILAVADAFDAIQIPGVSDQSLRDHIALRILRVASGTQFDPFIVHTLSTVMQDAQHRGVARDNTLRGKPAYTHRRSHSGTPTAPTVSPEALTSRGPQAPLLHTDARPDRPQLSNPMTDGLTPEDLPVIHNRFQRIPHSASPIEEQDVS